MDPARFCSQSRLVIVAGKGGVGKTTVSAALALMAAKAGLDTLIVEVEGKNPSPTRYATTALRRFFGSTDRRHPTLTLIRPGEAPLTDLFLAIVANSWPWTYFGSRPVVLTPTASFDAGLDLVAMRRLRE